METINVREVANEFLTCRLRALARQEREALVEFLAYLGEVDRRRLYLEIGFPSLFAFLTDYLGYQKPSASRRNRACRLMARFPVVADYLADGRLCLSTLVELYDVLEEPRVVEILDRAAGRTIKDVERLVATINPQPAPEEMIRKLPDRAVSSGTEPARSSAAEPAVSSVAEPARHATVQPINATQHVVRFTVGDAFLEDLESVKAALSHQLPGADLARVFHHCLHLALEACEERRMGRGRSKGLPSPPGSRYNSTGVTAEVWRRDDGRCAYVSPEGRRCNATHFLQLHHIDPHAKGGPSTVDNLSLRCQAHNQFHAVQDFGAGHIARAIAERQQALF